MKMITIRVQAKEGTKRLQVATDTHLTSLYELVTQTFNYTSYDYQLYRDKERQLPIISSRARTIGSIGISHGDLIYLIPINGAILTSGTPVEQMESTIIEPSLRNGSTGLSLSSTSLNGAVLAEDEIDTKLKTQTGLISRSMDTKMCRHDEKGCCVFCAPLEPYDENYLRAQNIKHLSFHSYLRKLTGGIDKGKFAALEDLNVTIKDGCPSHPPWPQGICSKCQPSAVTLNRQCYRHVDNVMFENPQIVENFLGYWRASGLQRTGLLYGRYEEHPDVPLGIRARVATIYEPPQESTRDRVRLLPDDKASIVDDVATGLGLKCVGWIFTDLIPEDVTAGKVKHLRGINTYFLSAQECVTAAAFQNQHPNICKASPKGTFGSKFATVLVTGDETHHIHMVGYQVSNQCMSLVREKCLVPTKDAPEFGYIIDSSEKKYVPDVFFKQKDEYGNEVTRLGRPLPVEYLLVDVTVSTPKEPISTFTLKEGVTPFPIENRYIDGSLQDFSALATYLSQFTHKDAFLRVASDFHFLTFIATMEIVHLRDYIGPLLTAVRDRNGDMAEEWAKSDYWATVEGLIEASSVPSNPALSNNRSGIGSSRVQGGTQIPSIASQSTWTCIHCTYMNSGQATKCEVCDLPRFS